MQASDFGMVRSSHDVSAASALANVPNAVGCAVRDTVGVVSGDEALGEAAGTALETAVDAAITSALQDSSGPLGLAAISDTIDQVTEAIGRHLGLAEAVVDASHLAGQLALGRQLTALADASQLPH